MNPTQVLSLAGLPASGKTTLCRMLAESDCGFTMMQSPKVDHTETDSMSKGEFFQHQKILIHKYTRDLNVAKADSGGLIVCDRGIEDIYCFSEYILGDDSVWIDAGVGLANGAPCSDFCIYLDASNKMLEINEQGRSKPMYGRGLGKRIDYWQHYREWFYARPNVWRIPVDGEAPQQTYSKILTQLNCSLSRLLSADGPAHTRISSDSK